MLGFPPIDHPRLNHDYADMENEIVSPEATQAEIDLVRDAAHQRRARVMMLASMLRLYPQHYAYEAAYELEQLVGL